MWGGGGGGGDTLTHSLVSGALEEKTDTRDVTIIQFDNRPSFTFKVLSVISRR